VHFSAAMTARWVFLLVIAAGSGCASGRGDGPSGDGQRDASVGSPRDGAPPGPGIDAPPGGTDAAIDAPGGGGGGGGLDPDLSLPDPSGQVCSRPGRTGAPDCPAAEQVCRFFTPTEGRCEPCTDCRLLGQSCAATSECDIQLECYRGQCVSFCTLGTFECGAVDDCLDIGHATRGVCRP
jgi:hypothetical protein